MEENTRANESFEHNLCFEENNFVEDELKNILNMKIVKFLVVFLILRSGNYGLNK